MPSREATILEHVRSIRVLTERRAAATTRRQRKDLKSALVWHQRTLRKLTGSETTGDRVASLVGRVLGGAVRGSV